MGKLKDLALWFMVSIVAGLMVAVVYPFYVVRNLGYHLRAPSVLLYSLVFFALDRASKAVINSGLFTFPIPVIDGFFNIAYVRNPGVAFGWFPDWRLPPILMALLMVVIIAYYSFQLSTQEKLTRWALALLVGGAMGNLYDRISYGYVIDFIEFHYKTMTFPVFNFADIAIDVGVALLFIDIFFLSPEEEPKTEAQATTA